MARELEGKQGRRKEEGKTEEERKEGIVKGLDMAVECFKKGKQKRMKK